MIEHNEEKKGGLEIDWKGSERYFWQRIKAKLNLFDPLEGVKKENTNIWYT